MTDAKCRRSGWPKPCWKSWGASALPVCETQRVEGHWHHGAVAYRDDLVRVVVDVPDEPAHREWVREFKGRWKTRLEQLDLWVVSHPIDVE